MSESNLFAFQEHPDSRIFLDDPGAVAYMSNKISAMENEIDASFINIPDNFTELPLSAKIQINRALGLEANRFTDGIKSVYKFLKENVIKFINFVCGFFMKFSKGSLDLKGFIKQCEMKFDNITDKMNDLDPNKFSKARIDKEVKVEYIFNSLEYAVTIFIIVSDMVKSIITDVREERDPKNILKMPLRFTFLIHTFALSLSMLKGNETDSIEKHLERIKSMKQKSPKLFEDYVHSLEPKEEYSKTIVIKQLKASKKAFKEIKSFKVKMKFKDLFNYLAIIEDTLDQASGGSSRNTRDYLEDFKAVDRIRKYIIHEFQQLPSDADKFNELTGTEYTERHIEKIMKLIMDSGSIIVNVQNIATLALKNLTIDMKNVFANIDKAIEEFKESQKD